MVDAVVEVPFGSYPGNMPYEYYSDEEHLRAWLESEKDPAGHERFLEKYIYSCKDHFEYLQKCGGLERMMELRRIENMVETSGGQA